MSEKSSIKINGEEYEVDPSQTILEACRENGIFIPTLCEVEEIKEPFGGCRVCLTEVKTDQGKSVTTSCDTPVQDGMEVRTNTEEVQKGRKMALELLLSEHVGDCVAPCSIECPASLDVQGYLAHIANGRPIEAVKLIKEKTPLAASLGRACFAPCEDECRRQLVEEPIAIRQMKQYAAEKDLKDPWTPEIPEETDKSIGIVGGGPAGLTAAYFLRLEGHSVKIYDAMPELGGMMRYGIPNYRLPNDILRQEINWILDLGIEKENNTKIGEDIPLEEIRSNHDAVLMATGAWESWIVPVDGKDLPEVDGGTDFLVDYHMGEDVELGEEVVVVGCGGCAMDTARVAKRLGSNVTIVYRRTEEQAPAPQDELEEAKEEGIEFKFLLNPEEILGEDHVEGVKCAKMELGEPDESGRPKPVKIEGEYEEIECDNVLFAIGESPETDLLEDQGIEIENHTIKDHGRFQTNYEDVFSAGDSFIGPSSIAESTGMGREAAYSINAYLEDNLDNYQVPEDYEMPYGYVHTDEKTEEDFTDEEEIERVQMPVRDPEERIKDFDKIELGFEDEMAISEGERCLECGCLDRFDCLLRDYAEKYDAEQEEYAGFTPEYEIDDTHPRVERDPNKCILCGSCVRTTEEIHGEGVLEFTYRGLESRVEPAYGDPLGEVDSDLIGDLADACPTGALEEKIDDKKPGPFEQKTSGETYCNGCGLNCPSKIMTVYGRPVSIKPAEDPVYSGHLCDKGKFETLPNLKERIGTVKLRKNGKLVESNMKQIKQIIEEKEADLIVSPDSTNEELEKLEELAKHLGTKVKSKTPDKVSNATLEDLLNTQELYVDKESFVINPNLKMFVKSAKDNGAEEVTSIEDLENGIAVIPPHSDEKAEKMIVPQEGANGFEIYERGTSQVEITSEVVILYDVNPKELDLEDETIVLFSSEPLIDDNVDAVVPIRSWIEKEGTVINTFGEEVNISPIIDPDLPTNTERISNLV